MSKRVAKYLVLIPILKVGHVLADFVDEGQKLGENFMGKQQSHFNEKEAIEKLQSIPCYSNYQRSGTDTEEQREHGYISQSSAIFNTHMNAGKKDSDPIKQDLMQRSNQSSAQGSNPNKPKLQDAEAFLRQKHRWHINSTDPLFEVYNKVSKEEEVVKQGFDIPDTRSKTIVEDRIIKCKEGSVGNTQTCTKRLVVIADPQADIVKNITANFTARCYNLVTFSINLVTGSIVVSQCENEGQTNISVDSPIGTEADLNRVSIALVSSQHIGESGVQFRNRAMTPSVANGFTVSFTAFQPKTGRKKEHEKNKNNVRGGVYTWKVTIPQKPKLRSYWEGCEDLEKKSQDNFCELVESQQKGIQETRNINGYPSPVTQPFWQEDRIYLCGQGSRANGCDTLKAQGCEQIDSKCISERNKLCMEYEQTYKCSAKPYQNHNGLTYSGTNIEFLKNKGECERKEAYEAQDFGEAVTYWSALTEMNNQMKDGLSGITGNPNNPSIFHGKCQRCTVKLGSFFQDCCKLRGIAKGLFGGCKHGEKELAIAAVKDKRCHKVSDLYCSNKIAGVCVEKKEAYCCYGSQIAKIVQEIAHQQLNIPWGTGEEPNCVSLTSSDLSRLDFDTPFAREQLSVLIGEIQATAQDKFNKVQGNIAGRGDMTNRVDALQKSLNNHFSKDRPQRSTRAASPQDSKQGENK